MTNINTTSAYQSIQVTVADTALSLVDFGFTQEEVALASRIRIFINTNGIRIDWSGNPATVSSGAIVSSSFDLVGNENISNLSIIRDNITDSEVFIILES